MASVDFRGVREALGLTQEQMGRLVGVGFVTVNRYERCHADPRGLQREVYEAIATVLRRRRKDRLLASFDHDGRQRFLMTLFQLAYG